MNETDSNGGEDDGFVKSVSSARRAINEAKATVWHAFEGVQQWVQRRGRLTQLIIGGFVATTIQRVVNSSSRWVTTMFDTLPAPPTFTTSQLLLALIGVGVGQTAIQTRSLNKLEERLRNMRGHSDPRPDGGKELPPRDEKGQFKEEGTSGGGAIGGAIAGAALGSSYGPGGTIGGAIFGAVLGDVLEQESKDN